MYRFRSSDITNERYIDAIQRHSSKLTSRYEALDLRDLREIIFYDEINDNVYNNCMFAITMGDQLNLPIVESEARLLFFTLQVNRQYFLREYEARISNMSQAKLMYDHCNGHYLEITRKKSFRADVEMVDVRLHLKCMFEHSQPFIMIPVVRIKDGETNSYYYTIAGGASNSYMTISFPYLNIMHKRIHRGLYLRFFGSNAAMRFASKNDIIDSIDENDAALVMQDILTYLGLSKEIVFKKYNEGFITFDPEFGLFIRGIDHNPEADNEKKVYWTQYVDGWLTNTRAQYVPLINGNFIELWFEY